MLKVVKSPWLRKEDMHHNVHKVYRYPLISAKAVHTYRLFSGFVAAFVSYRLCDSLHLCRRATLTDNEILSDRTINVSQIHNADVFTFLVFNSVCNDFKQRFC